MTTTYLEVGVDRLLPDRLESGRHSGVGGTCWLSIDTLGRCVDFLGMPADGVVALLLMIRQGLEMFRDFRLVVRTWHGWLKTAGGARVAATSYP